MADSDEDRTGSIERDEYLNFINVFGEQFCLSQDELTLEQHAAFNTLACFCRSIDGNDDTCCLFDNGKLTYTNALNPAARTISELIFLTSICTVTFQTLPEPRACPNNDGGDDNVLFDNCSSADYYADLLSMKPDVNTWTREDVTTLIMNTHRRVLPNVAPVRGDDDILLALVDLYPGNTEGTVHLVYRDIDFPAVPAGSPNTWKREDLWPISRGVLRTSPALTDVHSKIPADYTVLFVKGALFFGECGTVEMPDKCQSPATSETAPDTEQDGKIFAPPQAWRGDIARALFYTQLRYALPLGLVLADCPPFGSTEFGYLSAVLEWHGEDPVSPNELARNDRACARWQGNRNPFVDYPQLVQLFFGEPDVIVPGTTTYSRCTDPTASPTTTPNACSTLRAGDLPIYLFNSDDPDQIIFYALADIDADVEFLYVTDNAWTGTALLSNEGTMRVSIHNM